jgi:hypothetical protein
MATLFRRRLHVDALPGEATCPSAAAFTPAGDFDLTWFGTLVSYATGATQRLVSKWETTGNNRSYGVGLNTVGRPFLFVSSTGANSVGHTATVTPVLEPMKR